MPEQFAPTRRTVVIAAAGVIGTGALAACSTGGSTSTAAQGSLAGTSAGAATTDAATSAATDAATDAATSAAATTAPGATTAKAAPTSASAKASASKAPATTKPAATSKAPAATTKAPAPTTKAPAPTTQPPAPTTNQPPDNAIVKLSNIPVGGARVEGDLIIVRTGSGSARAFVNKCTHQGCALGVNGSSLDCPCHGSKFNLSGQPTQGPAAQALGGSSVKVVNGYVVLA